MKAKPEEQKSPFLQQDIDQLLDLRPRSLRTLSALKSHLQASENEAWLSDYNVFKGQCMFPQRGTISVKDGRLDQKQKERVKKEAKRASFAARNSGDFPEATTNITAESSTPRTTLSHIKEENILPRSPRQSALAAQIKCGSDATVDEVEEAEWELPYREQRRLRKRPDTITLTLPAQNLPSVLAKTSIVTKTSSRHELKIMSTVVKAGGADIYDTNLSTTTIWRRRRSEVASSADAIRDRVRKYVQSVTNKETDFVVLHFDGKIIQYISGECDDRLAICMSVPNYIPGQFLASPTMPNGEGVSMANVLKTTVSEFGLISKIEALVFDTTASNTGVWKGSATRLEKIIGKSLL